MLDTVGYRVLLRISIELYVGYVYYYMFLWI